MGRLPIIQEPSDTLKETANQWNEKITGIPATTLHNLTYLTELEHYFQNDDRFFENDWRLSMKGVYSEELNKFLEDNAVTYEKEENLGEGLENVKIISEIDYRERSDGHSEVYIDQLLDDLEEATYIDLRDFVRTSKPLKNVNLGESADWQELSKYL